MPAKFKIDDEVRGVLERAKIEERSVVIGEQLDRSLYVKVNKVLEGAGGKWNRKSKAHLFDRDPRELLGLAVATGVAVNKKVEMQAFFTPAPVAMKVALLAELESGVRVLEPSAGGGALVRAVLDEQSDAEVVCYELDDVCEDRELNKVWCRLIETGNVRLRQLDFLCVPVEQSFDRCVMNPPFCNGQDMIHVQRAFGFLKPGGILVAIVSAMSGRGQTSSHREFASFIEACGSVYEIPDGAFRESGTDVRTKIVKVQRPR